MKLKRFSIIILSILIISTLSGCFKNQEVDVKNGNKELEITKVTSDDYNYTMPKFSADGRRIYYVSNESNDGYLQIWSMDLNGSNKEQITFAFRGIDSYDISPDGKHLVFSKWDNIYIFDFGNGDEIRLTQGWQPSFLENSKRIIYVSYTDLSGALLDSIDIIDIDGTNYTEIKGWFTYRISNPNVDKEGLQIIYEMGYTHFEIIQESLFNESVTYNLNSDNISYFDFGYNGDELIAIENGDLVKFDMRNSDREVILDIDDKINFFDLDNIRNKLVLSINGEIWLSDHY